jgi:hypothetical protein
MIQLNQTIMNLLSQPTIEAFYLIDFLNYRLTNFYRDLQVDGITFTNSVGILSVSPPKLSTSVDRETCTIVLDDPQFQFGQVAEQNLVGTSLRIRFAFVNQNTKQPDTNNTLLVYRGVIDQVTYAVESGGVGSSQFGIICSSPMANLDATRAFYAGKQFIRNLNSEDSSMDQVYEGAGSLLLKWGKK